MRGFLLRRLGRVSEAASALLAAKELDPNSLYVNRETTETLVAAGRCDDARDLIAASLQRYPSDDGINGVYAYFAMACDRDMKGAMESALKIEVSTLQQLQRVTDMLILGRDFDGEIKTLTDARDSWVRRPTIFLMIDNYLTWLYRETGQQEMAEQTMESARANAAQISDNGVTSLLQLMLLAALEGDVEATRQFGEQAIAAMPNDAWRGMDYSYRIGKIYALAGLKDEAFSILENIQYDAGSDILVSLDLDPFLDSLRDDPRLQQVRAQGAAQLEAALSAVQETKLPATIRRHKPAKRIHNFVVAFTARISRRTVRPT